MVLIPFGAGAPIERFVLTNGLTVLVLTDHSAPVVSLQIWYGVGSRHEVAGKTGLAHLFEHLMFGETASYGEGEFSRRMEAEGAQINAATWTDWTYYTNDVPTSALPIAITMEAQRMAGLVLGDAQVAREKDVVANERRERTENSVTGTMFEVLDQQVFTVHGYGHSTIGWMADIEGFTPEDCAAFHATYYAPNNATMVVVGDVDSKTVMALVEAAFGHMTASAIPVEDVHPEPAQDCERRVRITQPTSTPQLAVVYRGPAGGDVDALPLALLTEILVGGRASRIDRALVQETPLASAVYGWLAPFRDPGMLVFGATACPGVTSDAILLAMTPLIEAVAEQPVSQDELDRARAKYELGLLTGLAGNSGKAWQIGFGAIVYNNPADVWRVLAELPYITRADLLRVARRYLMPDSRTILHAVPPEVETVVPVKGEVTL